MHIDGAPLEAMLNGTATHDAVISFNIQHSTSNTQHPTLIHHLDLGTLLDRLGIAVRTGHHCAQPLMDRLSILGTVRASFALYNTQEEVDTLAEGIKRVAQMF
jgi:cysteine desulfurase/selenocysteine lyase